jgi:hypothetical protein
MLRQLAKAWMERALEAEMATHLGYEKSDPIEKPDANRRNGKSKKTTKGDFGELEITTPRDREATFELCLIGEGQTRMAGLDAVESRSDLAAIALGPDKAWRNPGQSRQVSMKKERVSGSGAAVRRIRPEWSREGRSGQ